MTQQEYLQRETLKNLLKQAVDNNPNLTISQKQIAKDNIDLAAQEADWVINMIRTCGYLS